MAIVEKRCPPAPQLPLLMLCAHAHTNMDHCFLGLSNSRIYVPKQLPGLHRTDCNGSIGGWLMLSDGIAWRPEGFISFFGSPSSLFHFEKVKNYFLNPVSGAKIMLPSQMTIPSRHNFKVQFLRKLVATTVPTSPNCIVAAFSDGRDLAFCKPSDKSWNLIKVKDEKLKFLDIELHEGRLYALTVKAPDFIMVFALQDFSPGCGILPTKKLVMHHPRPFVNSSVRIEGQTMNMYDIATYHLAIDYATNDMLMVVQTVDCVYEKDCWVGALFVNFTVPPRAKGFQVFKLDKSIPQWLPVETLRDQILFVGHRNCKLISATGIGHRGMSGGV